MELLAKNINLEVNGLVYNDAKLKSTNIFIDKQRNFLRITLAVFYGADKASEFSVSLAFRANGTPSQIDDNGTLVDLIPFLEGGGTYDKTKVVWGQPNVTEAINYFVLTSLEGDLEFTDVQPNRQIAIDWIGSVEIYEGVKIEDVFNMPV